MTDHANWIFQVLLHTSSTLM